MHLPAPLDARAATGHTLQVTRRSPDICLRQLIRLRTEMVASVQMAAELFPDMYHGIEFGVVARACLPDWVRGDGLARPGIDMG